MTHSPTESAVIVAVDVAEPVVGRHRARLDEASSWGVPAHVTILFPFVPPAALDDATLTRLADAVRSVPAFDCTFARTRWFEQDVLWLAPEPEAPFRALTAAVWRAFPDHPPYGGAFDEVVPHLTIGERRLGTVEELRAAEEAITPQLPIGLRVDHALLIAGSRARESWRAVQALPLGTSRLG